MNKKVKIRYPNQDLGENAIYELAQIIYQHKLDLIDADLM